MREFRMEFIFVVESMIRGYHEYKTVWENPVLAEELHCTREIGKPCDPVAVAIQKQISGEMDNYRWARPKKNFHTEFCVYSYEEVVSSNVL